MALAEGIETALSFQCATGIPTWSTLSAGGLERVILPPPPLGSDLILAADNDKPGTAAARRAAHRFILEGRRVRIAPPPRPDSDWNDVLRGAAHDR
jgi:phage/plasmid primase-like uncharacterized protein